MNKAEELKKLEEEARKVLKKPGTNLVFADGNPDTKVMLIGEAPGYHEDQQGKPFVGAAGQLLNKLLASAGLKREDVYITNVLKNRPPNNRDPLPEEIQEASRFLDGQIEIINPEIIITLGRFSMTKFLPGAKITQTHGQPKRVGPRVVVPMFHPAAALRSGEVMNLTKADFEKLPEILKQVEQIHEEGQDPNQLSLI
jgi:uracil-DNA glycosylase family 4